jgi:hypothetical protein
MNEKDKNREYLIQTIAEIIERKGTSRNKAVEVVDGILIPTCEQIDLNYRILERSFNLPKQ